VHGRGIEKKPVEPESSPLYRENREEPEKITA